MPLPLPLTAHELESLAAAHGTPLQLYDEAGMRANCTAFLRAMRSRFPAFKQYFAVKALPCPAVLRLLVSEGCGLDCSSVSELHAAALLGVPSEDIIFTSNYTSRADLAVAVDQGVTLNLDDASLVAALTAARGGCPELISFRLNPGLGRTDSETASNVLGGPAAKFGVPREQIVGAYATARAAGATRFGMHMMTGSCVLDESLSYWRATTAALLDAVADVHAALGIEFQFINLGGGLGIPYKPGMPAADVEALAAALRETVNERIASHRLPFEPRLAMENGRYMTGPFGWLVARCEAIKDAHERFYGLDACMANLMRPGMYGR